MKNVKYYLIPLITSFLMLFNCVPVHAEGYYTLIDFVDDTQNYLENEFNNDVESTLKNYTHKCFQTVGFLINEIQNTLGIKQAIHQVDPTIDDNSTDKDAAEWIQNNVSVSGNSVEFSDNMNQFIKNYSNDFVADNTVYTGYSLDLDNFPMTSNEKQDIKTLVRQNQTNYYCFAKIVNGASWLCYVPKYSTLTDKDYQAFYFIGGSNPENNLFYRLDRCNKYGETLQNTDQGWLQSEYEINYYKYTNGQFTYNTNPGGSGLPCYAGKRKNLTVNDYTLSTYWYFVTVGKTEEIQIYSSSSLASRNSLGQSPYYYNNSTWQDFSSTSGDYIVTDENINTVSYGDTISYIGDQRTENNNQVDNSTVNNWITNTNNDNHSTGGSGGGSGGGGPGGSGSDDSGGGIGDIFGWLKTIGTAIASLIKGLGEFLAEIVSGLSDAISSLLEAISSLITNLHSSMSGVFFDIIGELFEWMPTEWQDLMTYAFTIMILVAVIKFIRG